MEVKGLFVALVICSDDVRPAFWLLSRESTEVVWKCVFASLRGCGLASGVPSAVIIDLCDYCWPLRKVLTDMEVVVRATTSEYVARLTY